MTVEDNFANVTLYIVYKKNKNALSGNMYKHISGN